MSKIVSLFSGGQRSREVPERRTERRTLSKGRLRNWKKWCKLPQFYCEVELSREPQKSQSIKDGVEELKWGQKRCVNQMTISILRPSLQYKERNNKPERSSSLISCWATKEGRTERRSFSCLSFSCWVRYLVSRDRRVSRKAFLWALSVRYLV